MIINIIIELLQLLCTLQVIERGFATIFISDYEVNSDFE